MYDALYSRNISDIQMIVQVPCERLINIKPVHVQNELPSSVVNEKQETAF